MCHYCNVFHLSPFWFSWYQTSPILGWTKANTENNPVDISGTLVGESPDCLLLSGTVVGDPKWTQKHDNVGGFKWSQSGPCPLGCWTHGTGIRNLHILDVFQGQSLKVKGQGHQSHNVQSQGQGHKVQGYRSSDHFVTSFSLVVPTGSIVIQHSNWVESTSFNLDWLWLPLINSITCNVNCLYCSFQLSVL